MSNDSILEVQCRADFAALFEQSSGAAGAVEDASKRIKTAMESAGEAPKKLEYSFMEARHAAAGFGEEVGIRIPRVLATALAHSETLGPVLASAFSVVAVGMFIQVLAQVPGAIDKVIGEFTGWDEAAKKTYADIVKGNLDAMKATVELASKIQAVNLIGLTGSAKYAQEIKNAGNDQARLAALNAGYLTMQNDLEGQITKMKEAQTDATQRGGAEIKSWLPWTENSRAKVKELQKQLEDVVAAEKSVTEQLREMSAVKLPSLRAESGAASAAEADRAAKEAARVQHEQIMAELNDAERAAKEKTKIATEEAKEDEAAFKSMDAEEKKSAEELAALKIRLMRQITAENNREVREQEALVKKLQEPWNQLSKSIARSMTQTTMGLIEGTMTIQKAFIKLGDGILQTMVSALAKVLAQHLTHALMVNVIEKSQLAQSIAAYLGYYSTKLATAKTAEMAQGTTDAGLAGAAAYASVMEALPFPVNIAVAPGVAAEAITATMALASFAAGTDYVPRTGFALLHEGEAVTPASQNRSGGGMHVHFNVSAVDAPGVQAFFDQHGEKMARSLSRQMRRGNRF
jgi:hypothetical protein